MLRWIAIACATGCVSVPAFHGDGDGGNTTDTSAGGKITFVQSKSGVMNGVQTMSLTFDHPVLAGDLLVVAVGTFEGALTTISDSAASTYHEPATAITTQGGSVLHLLYAANVAAASTLTIVGMFAAGGSQEHTMAIHDYRGAAVAPLDQAPVGAHGNVGLTATCTAMTTTIDNELYFAAMSHDGSPTSTNGAGYTLRELPSDVETDVPLATEDMTGPHGVIAPTFGLSYEIPWACAALTFESALP